MDEPVATSPVPVTPPQPAGTVLADHSLAPTWRVFGQPVPVGRADVDGRGVVWSVSPGEATVIGPRPADGDAVDLTHVRALISITGPDAVPLLAKLCHLDLAGLPPGAAARTRVAGVATELVHPVPERWLVVPSASFAGWMWETLLHAGPELDLGTAAPDHREVIP